MSDKIVTVEIDGIRSATQLLKDLGLEENGPVQRFFTTEFMRYTDPYVPMKTGTLAGSAQTYMEPDAVTYVAPYATYLYYGKLMVDPITLKGAFYNPVEGRFWSRPGVPKIMDPDGRDLRYDQTFHPKAGSHWAERSWVDNEDAIIAEVEDFIDKRF